MGTLTKEQILKADDLKIELVKVPEWNGDIYIRTMTGTERDAFEQSLFEKEGERNLSNIRARLCALTIVDEGGNRLFDDKDVEQLGKKSAAALDRIFGITQKLNAIGEKDVEELAKNSGSGPSEDSISD